MAQDDIIVFYERHATRLLREYIAYYNADRCRYGLGKDAPESRACSDRIGIICLSRRTEPEIR
ncbi:hypothetical protein KAR02_08350, partial [Candidatus Bipolaricaulota bacterium]|nr:hypothetical protein [Candidatus Bipolaricaulota bacterium]